MKAFGKILKSFSAAKRDKSNMPYLSDLLMENLSVCMEYLESQPYDQGLYRVSGNHEEVQDLEQYISNSTVRMSVNDAMLEHAANVHCIANAVKRVLQNHAPIIHAGSYEKATDVGGGAATSGGGIELKFLTEGLSAKEMRFLVALGSHLEYLVHTSIMCQGDVNQSLNMQANSAAYYNLSVCIGTMVFRPHAASLADLTHAQATAESKQRVGHFSQFLQELSTVMADEYRSVQAERGSKGLYSTVNGANTSTNTPNHSMHSGTGGSMHHHHHSHSAKAKAGAGGGSNSSKPSYMTGHHFDDQNQNQNQRGNADLDDGSGDGDSDVPIVDRSVKLVFPTPVDYQLPYEEDIIELFAEFGQISQVGIKSKFAVIVFSSPFEAIDCHDTVYDSPAGTATIGGIEGFRVKFIGDMTSYYTAMDADAGAGASNSSPDGYAVGASPSPPVPENNLTSPFSEDSLTDNSTLDNGAHRSSTANKSRIQDVSAINASTTAVNHMDVTSATHLGMNNPNSPTPVKGKKPAMIARNSSLVIEELGGSDTGNDDDLAGLDDSYEGAAGDKDADMGWANKQQQSLGIAEHRDPMEDSAASVLSGGGLGGTGGLDGGVGVYDDSHLSLNNNNSSGHGRFQRAQDEEFEKRENLLNTSGKFNYSFENKNGHNADADADADAGADAGAGADADADAESESESDNGRGILPMRSGETAAVGAESEDDEDFLDDERFGTKTKPKTNTNPSVPLKPAKSNSQSFYDANIALNKATQPTTGGGDSGDMWKAATSRKSSDPYNSPGSTWGAAANGNDTEPADAGTPPAGELTAGEPPKAWSPEPQPLSAVTVSRSSSKKVPFPATATATPNDDGPRADLDASVLRRQSVGEAAFDDEDDEGYHGAGVHNTNNSRRGSRDAHSLYAPASSSDSDRDSRGRGRGMDRDVDGIGLDSHLPNSSVIIPPTTTDDSDVDLGRGGGSRAVSPNQARALEVSKKLQKSRSKDRARSRSTSPSFRGQGLSQTQPVGQSKDNRRYPPGPSGTRANTHAQVPNPTSDSVPTSGPGSASNKALVSQIENYKEEVSRLKHYHSLAETSYNEEIVKLQCRNNDSEVAMLEQLEANRRLKLELSSKTAECASLLKAKHVVEAEVEDVHEKAKRDAYSTVLAQTRLIAVLDSQRATLEQQCTQTEEKYALLKTDYEKLSSDCLEWHTTALAAQQLLREHNIASGGGGAVGGGPRETVDASSSAGPAANSGDKDKDKDKNATDSSSFTTPGGIPHVLSSSGPKTDILRYTVQESVERFLQSHGTGYGSSPTKFASTMPSPTGNGNGSSSSDWGSNGDRGPSTADIFNQHSLSRSMPHIPSGAAISRGSSGSGSGNDMKPSAGSANVNAGSSNINNNINSSSGLGGTVGLTNSTQLLLQKLEQSRRNLATLGGSKQQTKQPQEAKTAIQRLQVQQKINDVDAISRSVNASLNASARSNGSQATPLRGVLDDEKAMSYYSEYSSVSAAVTSPPRSNNTGATGDSPGLRSQALQQWYRDNGAKGNALKQHQ